jgi:hypothetical protein
MKSRLRGFVRRCRASRCATSSPPSRRDREGTPARPSASSRARCFPAIAAPAGLLLLGQRLQAAEILGIALVMTAGAAT